MRAESYAAGRAFVAIMSTPEAAASFQRNNTNRGPSNAQAFAAMMDAISDTMVEWKVENRLLGLGGAILYGAETIGGAALATGGAIGTGRCWWASSAGLRLAMLGGGAIAVLGFDGLAAKATQAITGNVTVLLANQAIAGAATGSQTAADLIDGTLQGRGPAYILNKLPERLNRRFRPSPRTGWRMPKKLLQVVGFGVLLDFREKNLQRGSVLKLSLANLYGSLRTLEQNMWMTLDEHSMHSEPLMRPSFGTKSNS